MIAREGVPFILIGLAATLVALWATTRYDSKMLLAVALLFGLLTLFTTYFFRDPDRVYAPEGDILVSPADGKVIGIDRGVAHPFIGSDCIKISIFLSVFD